MRWLAAAVAAVALVLALAACAQDPARRAGTDEPVTTASTTTTLLPAPGGINSAIGPRPGEEVEPRSRDDRGGWLQLTVGAAILGGLLTVGGLAWRDARRRGADRSA